VHREGRWQLVVDESATTAIPDTIEGIVLARLDRLGARYRDVLQEASVAAASQPRFVRSLLEQVDPYPVELPERLRRLVSDGLLEALESELEALEYHFRHALTRDVAYDSLLYARRRELHGFIARAIELVYADRLDEYVTSLAHHYLEAEEWPSAFIYHRRAGERAQVLFANKNAIAYFHTALTIAEERMPDLFDAFDALDLLDALTRVREHLGDVLQLEGRYDEALEAYEAGRTLLTKEEAPADLARFYRKTAVIHERKADYPLALEWLERGLDVLGDQDHVEKARIYNWGGGVYYRQGDREQALEWRERALQIAQRLGDQREIADAYLIMAMIYSDWGETDRALDYGRRCLDAFDAAGDLAGSIKARNNVGLISYWADDWVQALEHYREGLRLSEMMGDGLRIGMFANNMGNVYLDQGRLEEAAAAYQRGLAVLQPIGLRGFVAGVRINLGKVAVTQGELNVGQAHLADALDLAQEIGARGFLPEIHLWQALIHLALHQHEKALSLARQAVSLAQELKDRKQEGGALRVLGRVYRSIGQPDRAFEHLEASLLRFMELKSTYEAAKTCFHLALVCLDRLDWAEEGRALLTQARILFAELGAQWDLDQVARVLDESSRLSTASSKE
jgi:tetratricopeptide (TPR) repeat protein